jgi:hypothetical protein
MPDIYFMNRNLVYNNPCRQTIQSINNGVIGIADLSQKLNDFRQREKSHARCNKKERSQNTRSGGEEGVVFDE